MAEFLYVVNKKMDWEFTSGNFHIEAPDVTNHLKYDITTNIYKGESVGVLQLILGTLLWPAAG